MKTYIVDFANRMLHTYHAGAWTSRSFDAFQRGKRITVYVFMDVLAHKGYSPQRYGDAGWLYTRGGL